MPKITIIGAGSGFGSRLSVDIMSRKAIDDSTICLCDLNEERLKNVHSYVSEVAKTHNLKTKFITGTDRRKLLPGSDVVVIAVSIGGPAYYGKPYEYEIRIPGKYGIVNFVGDTMGPGGIFRALRTAPEMLKMVDDINELAPGSLIINYTNPMAIITWVMSERVSNGTQVVGLCHGIQGTSRTIADYLNLPVSEMGFSVAGINHMSWFTKITHKKKDVYPLLFEIAEKKDERYKKDWVRFELMRNFGYFCTESTRHSFEYVPYFMHDEEAKKTMVRPIAPEEEVTHDWLKDMGIKISEAASTKLVHSREYTAGIVEAIATNVPYGFHGNVINHGLISNFHEGCCVEVPCLADSHGVHPCHAEPLPEQCAGLCRTNINAQELAAKAIREKSKDAALHAFMLEPSICATLGFADIKRMFEEMWKVEADMGLLSYYK